MSIVNSPGAPGSGQTAATDASTPQLSTASITHVANKKRQPKVMVQASYQALVSGLQATFQPTDTFVLKGGVLTRDQAIAQLGAYIAAGETTKSTRMQWISAVETERNILEQAAPVREGLRNILQARFGKDGTGLTTFGFRPAKAAKKTVTVKATALAKTAATRLARHTMGSVQKKSVTGNVVGITVTPLTASSPHPAGSTGGAGTQTAGGANVSPAAATPTAPQPFAPSH